MKRHILNAVALTVLSASFLCAQMPMATTTTPTPLTPAQITAQIVARLTTLLDLTTAQATNATTIFLAEQTALAALDTQFTTAETALQTAVLANNTANITTAAATLGGLTTQKITADAKADAAFYSSLTADQKTKYTTLKLGDLDGGGGFGGPMGGGSGGSGGPGHGRGGH